MSDKITSEDMVLSLEKLSSGNRGALYYLGMVGAQSLKTHGIAVFVPDALGNIHLVSPEDIVLKTKPKVDIEELDKLVEDDAIKVMVLEGRDEASIIEYLESRKVKAI